MNLFEKKYSVFKALFYSILAIIIYFFSAILAGNIHLLYLLNDGYAFEEAQAVLMESYYRTDALAMVIALVLLLIYIVIRSKKIRRIYGLDYIDTRIARPSYWLKGTVMLLGTKGIVGLWFQLLAFLATKVDFVNNSLETFQEGAGSIDMNEPYIFIFLSVVLFGPIVEELLFRGIIYREWNLFKGRKFAIIFSALAFGVFHWDLVQFTYTVLLGLLFAYLYSKTESIWLPIFLHILNNFIETLPQALGENETLMVIIIVLQLVLIIPSIWIFIRERKKDSYWSFIS